MSDRPDATELLAIARTTLLDKLLPQLPDELRYDTLMLATAMAIAARELSAGDPAAHTELARVYALLGDSRPPLAGPPCPARARFRLLCRHDRSPCCVSFTRVTCTVHEIHLRRA